MTIKDKHFDFYKAAAAKRLSEQSAYALGFCKAAEASGVEASQLLKLAAGWPWQRLVAPSSGSGSPLGDFVGRWISRLWGSPGIRGARPDIIKGLKGRLRAVEKQMSALSKLSRRVPDNLDSQISTLQNSLQALNSSGATRSTVRALERELERLTQLQRGIPQGGFANALDRLEWQKHLIRKGINRMYAPIKSESRKVLATRAATLGLGGTGVALAINNSGVRPDDDTY